MKKSVKFSPEIRERAVRMLFESRPDHPSLWAAVELIAAQIGGTAQTLHNWVRQHERGTGQQDSPTSSEQQRIKALEREVKERRKATEILRLASADFAQAEFDRRVTS